MSPWVGLQLLLGVLLVVLPVLVSGSLSLIVTVPIYLVLTALTLIHEASQARLQRKNNILRIINRLVSDLYDLTQGAGGGRHWAILQDLRGNTQFRNQIESSGNQQAGRLLDERCSRLFSDAGDLVRRVGNMNTSTSDKDIRDGVVAFGRLLLEYRTVVQEFLQFLQDTKGDKETIQTGTPFATRIHRELADGYDRLMDVSKQAQEELRLYADKDWLPDHHLTRFPRAALWS